MKNKALVSICASALVGLSLGATLAFAGINAGTGIVGSKHDMNRMNTTGDQYGRVCAYCHTPHHALDPNASDYMPLWSHNLTTQNFQAYESTTLNAAIVDPLVGPSRLCMSCHDGAIAVDQHYGLAGQVVKTGDNFNQIAVGSNGDLTNDHPIGFDYGAVAAVDLGIKPATNAFTAGTKQIKDALTNGIMTCATCHEVHNKDNVADAANTYNYFLYAQQKDSAICTSCHDK